MPPLRVTTQPLPAPIWGRGALLVLIDGEPIGQLYRRTGSDERPVTSLPWTYRVNQEVGSVEQFTSKDNALAGLLAATDKGHMDKELG